MPRSWIPSVVAAVLLLSVIRAGAQEVPLLDEPIQPHPVGDAAINSLKSPYCPGLMLEVCPTTQAKMLRDTIQSMAHAGVTTDSIVNWMLASFGEEYRAVPRTRGSGLWAWVMPPLALAGGLIVLLMALRHFRSRRPVGPRPQPRISEEDESVLTAALHELKASEEIPF